MTLRRPAWTEAGALAGAGADALDLRTQILAWRAANEELFGRC